MRNGDNYPGNYWRYLRALENRTGGAPTLPEPELTCHRCGRAFSSGSERNKHVQERECL